MPASAKAIEYILLNRHQYSDASIYSALVQAGWQTADIEQAFKEVDATPHRKWIRIIVTFFVILALAGLPAVFSAPAVVYILNAAMLKVPGQLPFSLLPAIPIVGLFSVISAVSYMLILYAIIRVKTGSPSGWKVGVFVIASVLLMGVLSTVTFQYYVKPAILMLSTPQ